MSSARSKVLSLRTMAACQAGRGSPTILTVPPAHHTGCPRHHLRVVAIDPAPEMRHAKPLARPRRLDIAASRASRMDRTDRGAGCRRPAFVWQPARSAGGPAQCGGCRGAGTTVVSGLLPAGHECCRPASARGAGRYHGCSACCQSSVRRRLWLSSSRSSVATLRPSPASTACWPRCRQRRTASWSRMHHPRTNWLTHWGTC